MSGGRFLLADLIAGGISFTVIVLSWSQRSSFGGGIFVNFVFVRGTGKNVERSISHLSWKVLMPSSVETARMWAGRLLAMPFQIVV